MIRKLLFLAALISLAALALGFAGRWHPLGDSLAVFRLHNIGLSAIFLFALPKGKLFIGTLALMFFSAASMAGYYLPQKMEAQDTLRLYQKNVLVNGTDRAALTADILEANPDFITFQELTTTEPHSSNQAFASNLKTAYPYSHNCNQVRNAGVTVFSRRPILETHCIKAGRIVAIKVQTSKGPLWVISMHLYWPYPYRQAKHISQFIPAIQALEGPKIIAGDFNMVPWSHNLNSIERASDTHIARPIVHSFDLHKMGLRLPIDHVLLPKGAKAKIERRGKLGSDHYGVLVNFSMP